MLFEGDLDAWMKLFLVGESGGTALLGPILMGLFRSNMGFTNCLGLYFYRNT